jgi:hypothetical protein
VSIYSAVGCFFVMFFACAGVSVTAWLIAQGVQRIKGRIDVGAIQEDSAIAEYLGDSVMVSIRKGQR